MKSAKIQSTQSVEGYSVVWTVECEVPSDVSAARLYVRTYTGNTVGTGGAVNVLPSLNEVYEAFRSHVWPLFKVKGGVGNADDYPDAQSMAWMYIFQKIDDGPFVSIKDPRFFDYSFGHAPDGGPIWVFENKYGNTLNGRKVIFKVLYQNWRAELYNHSVLLELVS